MAYDIPNDLEKQVVFDGPEDREKIKRQLEKKLAGQQYEKKIPSEKSAKEVV